MANLNSREQLLIELMNRARMDPLGEASRYSLTDLNSGLPAGTIAAAPKQVLAPNALLTDAARSHSQWMIDTDVFSHTGVNNTDPGQRMSSAGYSFTGSWTWGENISWSGSAGNFDANAAAFSQHRGLFLSAGHRENILNSSFKEAGIGALTGQFTSGAATYNALMTTENFARSGNKVFVTGVSYNDTDDNNFYSIGEGVGGRVFKLMSGSAVVGSADNMTAGGYAIGVTASGLLELHITGGGLSADIGASFVLGGSNVKIDLTDNNTIEANTSVTLTRATANLTLLGVEGISGTGNNLNNTIIGNANNNLLNGGAGHDVLNGGAGLDTAMFSGASSHYAFVKYQGVLRIADRINNRDGVDQLINVEQMQFSGGGGLQGVASVSYFTPLEYIASYSDLINAFGNNAQAGYDHFATTGRFEGRQATFNAAEYIASYTDLLKVFGQNEDAGAAHFLDHGRFEGRKVTFNALEYIASYADLINALGANEDNGITHFFQYGRFEGRQSSFNALEYVASYGDLIVAFGLNADAGAMHFINHGRFEGRSEQFNASQYLVNYVDLQAAFGNDQIAATAHYIQYGFWEGRTDHG